MLQPKRKNQATRQDSLNVYNQSRQVEKFYKGDKRYNLMTRAKVDDMLEENDRMNKNYKGDATIIDGSHVTKSEYRKPIDSNRYYQREQANAILNAKSPMQLFDKRINPRESVLYEDSSKGDLVRIATYNNIAIKPFDLLTDKEKAQRVKQYGRSGVPESYGKQDVRKANTTTGKQVKEEGNRGMVLNQTLIRPKRIQSTEPRKPVTSVSTLEATDTTNATLDADVKIQQPTRVPKYYEVEDTTNPNAGFGDGYGGTKSTYRTMNPTNLPKTDKRIITPKYAKGGKILIPKAANGAEILGAVAPLASAIPVVGEFAAPILSGAAALWGANNAKKMQRQAVKQAQIADYNTSVTAQDVYAKQFAEENRNDLPVYSKGGNINNSYKVVKKYALGDTIYGNQDVNQITSNELPSTGKLDAVGGDLIPVSDNAEVVSGNTHNQKTIDGSYGVTLSEDGQPVANVEDKEVIVNNNLVFSDKLRKGNKTFAEIALGVNTKIGELQDKLKGAKSTAEKFSLERTIQGLEKSNQDLFNEQEIVKNNTAGAEPEMVAVEDGIVPKGANGLRIPGQPTKPAWMKDMNKLVYGNPVTPVSELKPVTYKTSSPTASAVPNMTNTSSGYEEALQGIGSEKSSTLGRLAPMLADNIVNAVITSKALAPAKPLVRRAPIIDTTVNVNPQLAKIDKAVGSARASILGNTNSSAAARAAITSANLKGAELAGDVYAKKDALERDLKNKQAEVLANTSNTNAQLQDDYNSDVREHLLGKGASFSRNVSNAVEDYASVKESQLLDKTNQDIINLSLMDDPTGQKLRHYKRLGKSMTDADKVLLLKELKRRKTI